MNYHKRFTLFKKTYYISILSEPSDTKIFYEITDRILNKQKLVATKMMKENFKIALSDGKTIMDNIMEAKNDGSGNFHYEFKIKRKQDIVSYLKSTLGTYERNSKI